MRDREKKTETAKTEPNFDHVQYSLSAVVLFCMPFSIFNLHHMALYSIGLWLQQHQFNFEREKEKKNFQSQKLWQTNKNVKLWTKERQLPLNTKTHSL